MKVIVTWASVAHSRWGGGLRAASPYRVKGETPWQVKGGSHCPVELMLASAHTGYCLTLESAGLAAKLPFSQAPLWEKMSGTAQQFPSNRKVDEGGKDD